MAAKKIVTIVGATGAQGKGVVAAFINNPAYQVRAITRNPSSNTGKAMAAQGAEVVAADLNDVAAVTSAFAGSHIIFGVTNFFEPFIKHQSPVKAVEVEVQQGINLAAAAAATPTLEHYIWSTLPNAQAITGGKYSVPHFDGKNVVDAHIRADAALLAKTTFLWVTWYHSNYIFPMFTPYWIPTAGKHIQFANYAPDTPITTIGDVTANVGPFVKAVVEQPAATRGGRTVLAAQGTVGADEMLQLWARTKGTKAQFVRVGGEAFREIWPLWADEMGVMMEFWDEYREKSWTIAGETVLRGEDIGVVGLKGLEESFKEFEL
ncbi:hypothetical protein B0T25DRAFT_518933 [Lasiosphaeria hispida]|uniref:NmrA-like domain-containing protein n=1 Tax=Lasiosphaeria hispida TaxID=260671 RepID=A0AAJ0HKF1_9PEZI|nr:hypothetical protein B0T25DRAFT_518933 [Lasiosphaeria hispida]